jgi:hypothetical protein
MSHSLHSHVRMRGCCLAMDILWKKMNAKTVSVGFDILMAVTMKITVSGMQYCVVQSPVCRLTTYSQIPEHSNSQPYNLFAFDCYLFLRTR